MKKASVKVGQVYSCKVSGSVVPVRIDRENPRGGWDATNLKTQKPVRVKSAQRLRGKAANWPGKRRPKSAAPDREGDARAKVSESRGAPPKVKPAAEKKSGRPRGILDAAVIVLADADGPLTPAVIVDRALKRGLWSTKGKTPAATLYAAIIREIAGKGQVSRFRKTAPNTFELTGAHATAATKPKK